MSCTCKEKVQLPTTPGRLIFSFENTILIDNFCTMLESSQMPYTVDHDSIIVETDNLSKALYKIASEDETLLASEKEGIKVLPLQNDEILNFQALTKTRTLQQMCDLFDAGFLIEILDEGTLTSHFQPIVSLKEKKIFGYEALIRGVQDDGSLISPGMLFESARRSGLTFNLDRQARETSLKTGAVKKIDEHLFINFLPTSIYNPETCLQDTFKWAKMLEYDYSKIVFEVVETEKVEDFEHLSHILSYYRKQGVKTALDDVGAGFSNLNALIKLKPDLIKIDREIIDGIDQDRLKQSIFEALSRISNENGITVLAEGIERKEEFEYVMKNGADLAQGYCIGKPTVEPVRIVNIFN